MMSAFWYISEGKIRTLSAKRESLFSKLSGKLKLSLGIVAFETEIEKSIDPTLIQSLRRKELQLQKQGVVTSVKDFSGGNAGSITNFCGPSARLVQEDQFWTASLCGDVGVLLVGHIKHVVGAKSEVQCTISPSADPIGSVRRLWLMTRKKGAKSSTDTDLNDALSYIWAVIIRQSAEVIDIESFPITRGLAIYAGSIPAKESQIRRSGITGDIDRIVVGSPIYIEQI